MSKHNNVESEPSNNIIQTNQSNVHVITHQPPPNYGQINTQNTDNFHPNSITPLPIYQNGQGVPIAYIIHGLQGIQPPLRRVATAKDYVNLVWSIWNTLCCLIPLGIIALIISIVSLRMRRTGDDQGANCATIWAMVINAIATIGGIILIVLVIVPAINYSSNHY